MLNECGNLKYKKAVQMITYAAALHIDGCHVLDNTACGDFGQQRHTQQHAGGAGRDRTRGLYNKTKLFCAYIRVVGRVAEHGLWFDNLHCGSAGIDPSLHEAAMVDGASKIKRIWHIDLPGIMPTITILLILNVGSLMNVGYEKVLLLQNDLNMSRRI